MEKSERAVKMYDFVDWLTEVVATSQDSGVDFEAFQEARRTLLAEADRSEKGFGMNNSEWMEKFTETKEK